MLILLRSQVLQVWQRRTTYEDRGDVLFWNEPIDPTLIALPARASVYGCVSTSQAGGVVVNAASLLQVSPISLVLPVPLAARRPSDPPALHS